MVGAAVGYLFYGGLAKDEFSQPTLLTYILDIVISAIVGCIAGSCFADPYKTDIVKRRKMLVNQFRDMLDGLTTSLGAGNNMLDSLYAVREDLHMQYDESAYILQEMDVMISGVQNNVPIETMSTTLACAVV